MSAETMHAGPGSGEFQVPKAETPDFETLGQQAIDNAREKARQAGESVVGGVVGAGRAAGEFARRDLEQTKQHAQQAAEFGRQDWQRTVEHGKAAGSAVARTGELVVGGAVGAGAAAAEFARNDLQQTAEDFKAAREKAGEFGERVVDFTNEKMIALESRVNSTRDTAMNLVRGARGFLGRMMLKAAGATLTPEGRAHIGEQAREKGRQVAEAARNDWEQTKSHAEQAKDWMTERATSGLNWVQQHAKSIELSIKDSGVKMRQEATLRKIEQLTGKLDAEQDKLRQTLDRRNGIQALLQQLQAEREALTARG